MKKTRWILCVAAALIAFAAVPALAQTFQDGMYHRLEGNYSTVHVYNGFWGDPTTVELVSGSIAGLYSHEDSQVIVSAGDIFGGGLWRNLIAYDDSSVTITDGAAGDLYTYDNSNVSLSGGTIQFGLYAYENSTTTITGGRIVGGLFAYDNSSFAISAGRIDNNLYVYDASTVTISGGWIGGGFYVSEQAAHQHVGDLSIYGTLTVDGEDFAIGGQSVGYGTFDSGGLPERRGSLTCTLASGETMANNFTIYDGGALVLIPEPATLSLFIASAFGLLRRRHAK